MISFPGPYHSPLKASVALAALLLTGASLPAVSHAQTLRGSSTASEADVVANTPIKKNRNLSSQEGSRNPHDEIVIIWDEGNLEILQPGHHPLKDHFDLDDPFALPGDEPLDSGFEVSGIVPDDSDLWSQETCKDNDTASGWAGGFGSCEPYTNFKKNCFTPGVDIQLLKEVVDGGNNFEVDESWRVPPTEVCCACGGGIAVVPTD